MLHYWDRGIIPATRLQEFIHIVISCQHFQIPAPHPIYIFRKILYHHSLNKHFTSRKQPLRDHSSVEAVTGITFELASFSANMQNGMTAFCTGRGRAASVCCRQSGTSPLFVQIISECAGEVNEPCQRQKRLHDFLTLDFPLMQPDLTNLYHGFPTLARACTAHGTLSTVCVSVIGH